MLLLLLQSLTFFMICQKAANYKKKRIVMKNLIYIIFIISYAILLLDFITLSCVQFLEFNFDFNYIYITFVFIFVIYRFCAFIHMFILYTFILHFCYHHIHHLCNVCIHYSVIYSSMQSSFIFDIVFVICCIAFDICCHYL